MTDQSLNNLLKWGIENSSASQNGTHPPNPPTTNLDPALLAQLLGGPSDADLMRESMAAINSPDISLDNKLVAFDNFEQLIENLDNANNMESLGLWMPLVAQLKSEEGELRRMAAWCLATAVQNNVKSQERVLAVGAIPSMIQLAIEDPVQAVRKKAILALSSTVRNYQPGLDVALKHLPAEYKVERPLDAGCMEDVDTIIQKLRDESQKRG